MWIREVWVLFVCRAADEKGMVKTQFVLARLRREMELYSHFYIQAELIGTDCEAPRVAQRSCLTKGEDR
jgi:hypothetical protein